MRKYGCDFSLCKLELKRDLNRGFVCDIMSLNHHDADEHISTAKALETVAAGRRAENLLDFDDVEDSPDAGQQKPSGLAATTVLASTPAAANLLAGTSSNPLDDLVSIFGSASLDGLPPLSAGTASASSNVLGASPVSAAPPAAIVQPSQPSSSSQQDDLLGLF